LRSWDVKALEVKPHAPEILHSDDEGRTIVINLPAGEELQEHQVHERAWIVVVDGEVEITEPGGRTLRAGPGWLSLADPKERHSLRAETDTRILLMLAPWPGDGHPSA
jgi:quercetin dioxygenase-like cupin family protein